MGLATHVPADLEPDTVIDLLDDCREVTGVLGLPADLQVVLPAPRAPWRIGADVAAALDGYGDYGS